MIMQNEGGCAMLPTGKILLTCIKFGKSLKGFQYRLTQTYVRRITGIVLVDASDIQRVVHFDLIVIKSSWHHNLNHHPGRECSRRGCIEWSAFVHTDDPIHIAMS